MGALLRGQYRRHVIPPMGRLLYLSPHGWIYFLGGMMRVNMAKINELARWWQALTDAEKEAVVTAAIERAKRRKVEGNANDES